MKLSKCLLFQTGITTRLRWCVAFFVENKLLGYKASFSDGPKLKFGQLSMRTHVTYPSHSAFFRSSLFSLNSAGYSKYDLLHVHTRKKKKIIYRIRNLERACVPKSYRWHCFVRNIKIRPWELHGPRVVVVISWISIRLSVIERSQNVENDAFQIRLITKSIYTTSPPTAIDNSGHW